MFALGAQKNRLTEYLYLTYALVGPPFMPTPFPLLKGVFSGAEGEGVLSLVPIPSALVMGGIGHE